MLDAELCASYSKTFELAVQRHYDAVGEGYEVFIVTDASGGVSVEAHDMAVRRLVQAGAVPITWMAAVAEWQRDWARDTAAALTEVILEHGGATAVATAWEFQLLNSRKKSGA